MYRNANFETENCYCYSQEYYKISEVVKKNTFESTGIHNKLTKSI